MVWSETGFLAGLGALDFAGGKSPNSLTTDENAF
jgi:ammonia channel protein AmtB